MMRHSIKYKRLLKQNQGTLHIHPKIGTTSLSRKFSKTDAKFDKQVNKLFNNRPVEIKLKNLSDYLKAYTD